MKRLCCFCALLLTLLQMCSGQAKMDSPQQTAEQVVRRIIRSGGYEGHDVKELGPLGDAAAVAITKVLAGEPLTEAKIDSALIIVYFAFGDPTMVDAANREPRTTLFGQVGSDA
jgi:hypothetical protein